MSVCSQDALFHRCQGGLRAVIAALGGRPECARRVNCMHWVNNGRRRTKASERRASGEIMFLSELTYGLSTWHFLRLRRPGLRHVRCVFVKKVEKKNNQRDVSVKNECLAPSCVSKTYKIHQHLYKCVCTGGMAHFWDAAASELSKWHTKWLAHIEKSWIENSEGIYWTLDARCGRFKFLLQQFDLEASSWSLACERLRSWHGVIEPLFKIANWLSRSKGESH